MEQERIKNRLYGFYGSKLPIEHQKGYKQFLDNLINLVKINRNSKESIKEDILTLDTVLKTVNELVDNQRFDLVGMEDVQIRLQDWRDEFFKHVEKHKIDLKSLQELE